MSISPGTYKVEFTTPLGRGFGVVVVEGGKVRGGDSGMLYVGSYQETGDEFSAKIEISRHSNTGAESSVLGVDNATINLSGRSRGNVITTQGSSPQAPNVPFQALLSRIAD